MVIVRFVAILLFGMVLSQAAFAEKRVALVIGNSAYLNAPKLANPKNDASDIAGKLKTMGFDVVTGLDLDLAHMRETVRQFIGKLNGADMALFFYAGHGLQVNGSNYMAPTDARLSSFDDLDFEAMPIDLVLSAMERNTQTNLIFLDACRDNPLAETLARSMGTRSTAIGRGLAKIGSGVGSLIVFSTQPGNVALDGEGRNSPFTTALLKHLGTPGESVTDDMILVRRDVLAATDGKQVPWDNSSLTGKVVLVDNPEESQVAATGGKTEQQMPTVPGNLTEITYWNSIQDSTDKRFFEAYLKRYPEGEFSDIARLKIAAVERDMFDRNAGEPEQRKLQSATEDKTPPGLPGGKEPTRTFDPNLARRYALADLGDDADPRLVKALNILGRYELRYGEFRKHLYIAVLSWGTTWREAYDLAAKAGGHLVTIADKSENDFVYKLFSTDVRFVDVGEGGKDLNGPWIGLYQPKGSQEPRGGWRWVTGEPMKYSNWTRYQPNNYDGKSDVGLFYSYGARNPREEQRPIRWDDGNGENGKRGFIVEIEPTESG